MGYAAEATDTAAAALALVRAAPERYSCCLLDLTMPGDDGSWLGKALAAEAPALLVVLMSGVEEADAREQFAGLPVAGYLAKPFELDRLAGAVRAVIGPPAAD